MIYFTILRMGCGTTVTHSKRSRKYNNPEIQLDDETIDTLGNTEQLNYDRFDHDQLFSRDHTASFFVDLQQSLHLKNQIQSQFQLKSISFKQTFQLLKQQYPYVTELLVFQIDMFIKIPRPSNQIPSRQILELFKEKRKLINYTLHQYLQLSYLCSPEVMNKITRNICLIYFYVNDKQFNGTVISQELVDFLLPRFPEIEKDITKYVSGTEILQVEGLRIEGLSGINFLGMCELFLAKQLPKFFRFELPKKGVREFIKEIKLRKRKQRDFITQQIHQFVVKLAGIENVSDVDSVQMKRLEKQYAIRDK